MDPSEFAQRSEAVRQHPDGLDLTTSNPTRVSLSFDDAALRAAYADLELGEYAPDARGSGAARAAVARAWGQGGPVARAESLLLTSCTSEAYGYCLKLLCDPGEGVLVPRPSYPLLEQLVVLEGVRVQPYRLAYDGAWGVDWDSVERARDQGTRAILIVNPNNPTGHYIQRADAVRLRNLKLPVISDEVFFEYPRATQGLRLAGIELDLGISLGGLSKLSGLPQAKLGWMRVHGRYAREALQRLELIADSMLALSTATMELAERLLELGVERRAVIATRIASNWDWLAERVAGTPATLLHSTGGWSALLRLPATVDLPPEVTALEEQVLVQPGWFYDGLSDDVVVLSLLTVPSTFAQGVERLLLRYGA